MSPDQMADALDHIDGMLIVADYLEEQGFEYVPARLRSIHRRNAPNWKLRRDHFPSLDARAFWQETFRGNTRKIKQWQRDTFEENPDSYSLSWQASIEWSNRLPTLVGDTADKSLSTMGDPLLVLAGCQREASHWARENGLHPSPSTKNGWLYVRSPFYLDGIRFQRYQIVGSFYMRDDCHEIMDRIEFHMRSLENAHDN